MRIALLLFGGFSLVLASLLTIEILQPWSPDPDAADATGVIPVNRLRLPSAAPARARTPVPHGDEWVATILARPLFTRDRRPAPPATAAAATQSGAALPRLTGIAISPDRRRAIFAGADGSKPIVVEEGGSIDGFTVQAISPESVKVQGPGGERSVRLAFDPSPPPPPTPEQPQLPMVVQPPPYGQPVMPPPYPGFGPIPGRPGFPLAPNGQPYQPQFVRPRADLGETSTQPVSRSS
jgi:hypothetical protein